jgi:hypothetical protein
VTGSSGPEDLQTPPARLQEILCGVLEHGWSLGPAGAVLVARFPHSAGSFFCRWELAGDGTWQLRAAMTDSGEKLALDDVLARLDGAPVAA